MFPDFIGFEVEWGSNWGQKIEKYYLLEGFSFLFLFLYRNPYNGCKS